MTEQERPRTAEGQALIRDLMAWEPGAVESYRLEARILAIEAEGCQQAVALLREWIEHHQPEGYDGIQDCSDINDRTERWLAGLNASESPHEPGCILDDRGHDVPCVTGDASESGQPPEASDE